MNKHETIAHLSDLLFAELLTPKQAEALTETIEALQSTIVVTLFSDSAETVQGHRYLNIKITGPEML